MKTIKGHQGDVIFRSINSLPENAIPIKNKPIALGEHSGHCHIVTGDVELFEFEGKLFTVVGNDGASLQHIHESNLTEKSWIEKTEIQKADHNMIPLEKGVYEFWIQNSYNPYSKLMEKVID